MDAAAMCAAALALRYVLGVAYSYLSIDTTQNSWGEQETWNLTLAMLAFGMQHNGVFRVLTQRIIDAMVAAGHLHRPPGYTDRIITGPGICRSDLALCGMSRSLVKILDTNSGTARDRFEKQRLNSGWNEKFEDLGLIMIVGGKVTEHTEKWSIQVRKGQGPIVALEFTRCQLRLKLQKAGEKKRDVYFCGKSGRGQPEKGWMVVPWMNE